MDIKICGLRTEETVAAALDGGASHIGFIFFPKSPRNIDPEEAGKLRKAARGRALAVAVTVDASDEFLGRIVDAMQPDILQVHGKETPERVRELKARFGLPVMKALSISAADDLDKVKPFIGVADRLLFDAKPPAGSQLPGGNGVSFDWTLLTALPADLDYLLSGGINASNIGSALRQAHPAGIDVSSGVEIAPGVKEPGLIADFFAAVRQAETQSGARV
ncbi:MAG: phosphoribosylanthranilate isomerase [Rhizobiaceae bacterium]|nr:phosphoribosylanthranilate isomerase [Rhizobiaceae bacterium]